MIINVPIEPIEMRYSIDWQKWFKINFEVRKIPYYDIYGSCLTEKIEVGEFLDVYGTNYYKAIQLQRIIQLLHSGEITNEDVIFFHDLWFPGIEQIAYIRDCTGVHFKIMGCLHAGTYDPFDYLYQKGLGSWGCHFENMLAEIADKIFVATNFSKELFLKSRSINPDKIIVTGFPANIPESPNPIEKKDLVIFPHRHAPEKGIDEFIDIQKIYKAVDKKAETTEDCKTKLDYYEKIRKAKVAISFAQQETFGIAQIECTFSRCLPLVPNRLAYKELYFDIFRYDTYHKCRNKLSHFMNNYEEIAEEYLDTQIDKLKLITESAIPHMMFEIEK